MSNSNGIISAPIDLENDVYGVLQLSPTTQGYDLGYACKNEHGRINKWSRAKPYRKDSLGPVSVDVDPTRTVGDIWGMTPPQMRNNNIYFNSMVMGIISQPYQSLYPNWEYKPPRGGDYNEPFRITDFDGYNHNAQQVFNTGITNYKGSINLFDAEEITFFFMLMQGADFTMSEFAGAFTQYRFVVEIYIDNVGTPWYAMTAPTHRYVSANTIKEMQGWAEYITVSTNDLGGNSLVNKSIYVCMGIQNIQNGIPESNTGIVAPWVGNNYPFYKQIKFENYFNRSWKSLSYAFTPYKPTWYNVSDYPVLSFRGTMNFILKCQIERKGRRMYIIPEHPSSTPSGGYNMKIKAIAYGNYSSTQYAEILSSSLQIVQYTLIESTNEEGLYQEVYLSFNTLLKIGKVSNISIMGTVDNGSTWVQLDVVGVNITITA